MGQVGPFWPESIEQEGGRVTIPPSKMHSQRKVVRILEVSLAASQSFDSDEAVHLT